MSDLPEAKPSTSKDLQLPGEVFERAWEIWLDHFGEGNVEKLRAVGAFIFAAGRAQAAAVIRLEMAAAPIRKPMSPELAAELVEYCAQLAGGVADQSKDHR